MSLGVYVDAKNSSSISTAGATGTFVGIAGAGAVAGYFAGRGIDKRIDTHQNRALIGPSRCPPRSSCTAREP
jgi:hypothetical protein